MKKSCPGPEGHLRGRVNFIERLYEEKVDPSARAGFAVATVLAHAMIVSP